MRRLISIFTLFSLWAFPLHAEKLRVLTTFAPIDSLTRSVAGTEAEVQMLLPPGVGPHDFSFSPGDLKKVAAADVVVMNGLGMEDWLKKALKSALKSGALVIDTSKGIATLQGTEVEEEHDHSHDHGHHHHDHGGPNPHIWMDPQRAIQQVKTIAAGLAAKDPSRAETFETNAAATVANLTKLDEEIAEAVKGLSNKRIITFHDSFPYFAARYGLEIVGVFEAFPGKEPSPKYLIQLQKIAKTKKAGAVFAEPQYSPKILQTMAKEIGIPVAALDPLETGEPSADLYERVMRSNLQSLQQALTGR